MAIRKYTDEQLKIAFEKAVSMADLLRNLGLKQAGGSYQYLIKACNKLGLDPNTIKNKSGKGQTKKRPPQIKNELVFIKNSKYLGSSTLLKQRAKALGYIKDICEICGQKPIWNNKPLVLIIDHIDGDRYNHSPENLRSVCPNCDIQLPTSRGKNVSKKNLSK